MKKPLIGIVLDYQEKKISEGGYSDLPWYALRIDYAKSIAENGGTPLHIPYEHDLISEYIKTFDGFIIPGGGFDIHPEYYNEKLDLKSELYTNHRTEFELNLLKQVIAKKIPLLGICGGHQLLNVALGGTLYQDIGSSIKTNIEHRHTSGQGIDWHDITLDKSSLLYKIIGEENYKVNSHHHQAVQKLGENLITSATAPDGIIEAIEHKTHPFCMGVEWHPEYQKNQQDQKLIRAFIEAAKEYSNQHL